MFLNKYCIYFLNYFENNSLNDKDKKKKLYTNTIELFDFYSNKLVTNKILNYSIPEEYSLVNSLFDLPNNNLYITATVANKRYINLNVSNLKKYLNYNNIYGRSVLSAESELKEYKKAKYILIHLYQNKNPIYSLHLNNTSCILYDLQIYLYD